MTIYITHEATNITFEERHACHAKIRIRLKLFGAESREGPKKLSRYWKHIHTSNSFDWFKLCRDRDWIPADTGCRGAQSPKYVCGSGQENRRRFSVESSYESVRIKFSTYFLVFKQRTSRSRDTRANVANIIN